MIVAVTGTTNGGTETARSELSDRVAGPTLVALAEPTIEESNGYFGREMRIDPGTWNGGEAVEYEYQWQRCEASECVDIVEATGSVYRPVVDDTEHTLRVVVAARTESGRGYATSDPTATVEFAGPMNTVAPLLTGDALEGEVLETDGGDLERGRTAVAGIRMAAV